MFSGSYVALITPFDKFGKVDESALRSLVRWHIKQGTHGLVPTGTTGESSVLSANEQELVIKIVCEETGGGVPVIAGAGSNNTIEALNLTLGAQKSGADAVLHVAGYYNRPNQEGLYQHFLSLHESSDMPIILYNIPSRTIVNIEPKTMARLALLPRIVGVKDATSELDRPLFESMLIRDKEFSFLSGDDSTAIAYNAHGGNGCISVTANVAPSICAEMQEAMFKGNFNHALLIQKKLLPLHKALFLEPSPAGIKYAVSKLGLIDNEFCRLPMVPLLDSTKLAIDKAMSKLYVDYT